MSKVIKKKKLYFWVAKCSTCTSTKKKILTWALSLPVTCSGWGSPRRKIICPDHKRKRWNITSKNWAQSCYKVQTQGSWAAGLRSWGGGEDSKAAWSPQDKAAEPSEAAKRSAVVLLRTDFCCSWLKELQAIYSASPCLATHLPSPTCLLSSSPLLLMLNQSVSLSAVSLLMEGSHSSQSSWLLPLRDLTSCLSCTATARAAKSL